MFTQYSLKNVNLDARSTHGFIAHADEIIAEAMLRRWYEANPDNLIRVDTRDKESVAKAAAGFCFDYGGGLFDHHSQEDRNIRYSNGIILSTCGKVLAAAVNDGLVRPEVAEYILNHGLYAVQAQDNGQDFYGACRPFQVLTLLSEPETNFEYLVEMANTIISKLIRDAEKFAENLSVFNDALKDMDSDGIITSEYINNFAEMAISENLKRTYNEGDQLINFHVFPSIRGGWMAETIKTSFGVFIDRYSFDPEKDKAEGIIFIHPSGFLVHGETEEICKAACRSALNRARAAIA